MEKLTLDIMNVFHFKDKNYPELLKKISNPPSELYFNGNFDKKEKYPLAVVGTRKISDYGRQVTEYFVKVLAQAGVTIISGLALGVDGLAHKTALKAKGRTIAILGSGLNNIYPTVHKKLAQDIIDSGGAVVTEYEPDINPSKITFPARNRIISGLSLGVLVIEAPQKSGALITATQAIKQGRKVFVIPARIYDKNSAGSNNLLKKGAQVVTKPEDILKSLGIKPLFIKNKKISDLSPEQNKLLEFLNKEPISIDDLAEKSNLPAHKIVALLTEMEIKGVVRSLGAGKYVSV